MRFRVISALFLSIALVAGASLFKPKGGIVEPTIVSVEKKTENDLRREALAEAVSDLSGDIVEKQEEEKLNTTDLIGRQLMIDYINLATAGQATTESLESLVDNYVEQVGNLDQSDKLSLLDITLVPDSESNLKKYSSSLKSMMSESEILTSEELDTTNSIESVGEDLYASAKRLSAIYFNTANKLKGLPAPTSLSKYHLDLINSYIKTSEAFRYLALTEEDPVIAFAGATSIAESVQETQTALTEINRILSQYDL